MVDTVPATVAVATQSAWASKINWTQAISGASMALVFLTGGKFSIPPDIQAAMVTAIGVIGTIVTWVMRTWFTKTITPASVTNATSTVVASPVPVTHVT